MTQTMPRETGVLRNFEPPHLETLRLEVIDGDIAVMTINRPDRMNSQTTKMFEEHNTVAMALRDTNARALIIRGAGERAFCAGFDLDEIDEAPGIDLAAAGALAAGSGRDPGLAVQAFGEDARDGGLAHPAGAGEEKGVMHPAGLERVHERTAYVILADQLGKGPRTPFARERRVGLSHRLALRWRRPASAKAPAPDIAAAAAAFRP